MTKYSVTTSYSDEETLIVADNVSLPRNPRIGQEVWIQTLETVVIWTGQTWQSFEVDPPVIPADPGQIVFTTTSTDTLWTVPAGVTSISVLCVGQGGSQRYNFATVRYGGGGGALAYSNNVSVTPGEQFKITFPIKEILYNRYSEIQRLDGSIICSAEGGGQGTENNDFGGRASASFGNVTNSGGPASTGGTYWSGGGAAGYSGGAHAAGNPQRGGDSGGGGIGLQGTSVGSPSTGSTNGAGAYGGESVAGFDYSGGTYGGGAAGKETSTSLRQAVGGNPGSGAVRIIWGPGRSYPANAEDV